MITIGLKPWLPWPLCRSEWWTAPVRAERLAALRIGVGVSLFLDIVVTYIPRYADFFGANSISAPGTNPRGISLIDCHRSLLLNIASQDVWLLLLLAWAVSAIFLTVGIWPRVAAAAGWLFSISLLDVNPTLHNSGDHIRCMLLLILALSPCGEALSWKRRPEAPVYVYPWPLRLLFIQLAVIYFMNGLFKMGGDQWHDGSALSVLLGDASLTRWSFAAWPIPDAALRMATWTLLAWEISFPILIMFPRARTAALLFGVLFHLVTGATMRLAAFPLYMLCMYLPLVPWERLSLQAFYSLLPHTASKEGIPFFGSCCLARWPSSALRRADAK